MGVRHIVKGQCAIAVAGPVAALNAQQLPFISLVEIVANGIAKSVCYQRGENGYFNPLDGELALRRRLK
jgi:hypothetical protein